MTVVTTVRPVADKSGALRRFFSPQHPAVVVQRVMLLVLLVSIIGLAVANPSFRNPANLLNIVQQASMVGIVACGMQLMIISGGFDLSVGATAAAAGCLAATVSLAFGVPAGLLAGMLLGLAIGIGNGWLIAKVGMNPFVSTFGTQAIILGTMYALTEARPIAPLPREWRELGFFHIGGLTFPSMVFIAVVVVLAAVLHFTRYGQHVYAVGSNKVGTSRAGVNVDRVLIATYAIGGVTAAIAGLLLTSIAGIGSPQAGTTWALLSIAAVVIGGTPLSGGLGGITSAVIGIFALTILNNAMTLYSISAFWQPAFMGTGVLLAVGYEAVRRGHKS
ncbi:ABC transporter permease [Rhizobium sp. BK060]|uniref:ABC transporter permease n=1 Tax=Rhizobium sp. BK060 TaxID=2587096 RepID=UPI001614E9A0|nr:ABC transporter permease [Rhizobium sp. BK060]MBB3396041.1 ribose/xylose/arabinose/galactoside ABC-type transport system permease subunit [Rhizobium sp. BK060]